MGKSRHDLREIVKRAALDFCADVGMTEDEIAALLRDATILLEKRADGGWFDWLVSRIKNPTAAKDFVAGIADMGLSGLALLTAAPLMVGASGGYVAANLAGALDRSEPADAKKKEEADAYRAAAVQLRLAAERKKREREQSSRRYTGGLIL